MKRLIFCVMALLLSQNVLGQSVAEKKNVILFLGDGMGISTITAARIFAGQRAGLDGEEYDLAFDRFPNVALIKTYNTDAQVPDSAGTISAILTGEKTRMGVLGVTAGVARSDCAAALDNEIPTLLEYAEEAGFASGVVTTTSITHATPAGTYAHVPDRDWENSSAIDTADRQLGCRDIAAQLVEFSHGDGIDVILGGGRRHMLPHTVNDPEYPDKQGRRDDERNLIDAWVDASNKRTYVWNAEQFGAYQPAPGRQLMGLFEPSHLQFEHDRANDPAGEPSLSEMTAAAIRQLQHNDKGFFLLVEGGRIDHAHHFGNAHRALQDTVAFSDAVQTAVDSLDMNETLIIVTADHSHTLTISGYPRRGNPITGKITAESAMFYNPSGLPYTTLSYANGPGYTESLPDLTEVDTTAPDYQQVAAVPLPIETHAGEDVAAFAIGVNAAAVRGVMEQNKLFFVMRKALLGE